jgi:hypothetical protein
MSAVPAAPALTPARFLRGLAESPWPLAVILTLGLACRLRQYVACSSYWYDEAYLLLNVAARSFGDLVGPLDWNQVAPPLFLWALRGLYEALGQAEWVMRLPAALAGALALFLIVPLARRAVGAPGWLWAVGLCAGSNHALLHGVQVKPYAGDLLATEVILLAAVVYLAPESTRRGRTLALVALLVSALLMPWLSFPSVFVLGGVGLALGADALRRGRAAWLAVAALGVLLIVSAGALWLVAARHHNSDYQRHCFAPFFLGTSSPWAAAAWTVDTFVHIAHYGNRDVGIPLALLAAVGIVVCGRRRPLLAVLLLGPLALATAASALERYPLGDRLAFFAVPCLWLLTAAGAGALAGRLRAGAGGWVGLAALAAVLAPGAVQSVRLSLVEDNHPEFREAFTLVRAQCDPGDAVWLAYPEVYEVYFGKDRPLFDSATPAEILAQAARARRLWTVAPPETLTRTAYPALTQALRDAGVVPVRRYRHFHGIEVTLYQPVSPAP